MDKGKECAKSTPLH